MYGRKITWHSLTVFLAFLSSSSWSKEVASSLNRPTSSQFFKKRVGVGVWSGQWKRRERTVQSNVFTLCSHIRLNIETQASAFMETAVMVGYNDKASAKICNRKSRATFSVILKTCNDDRVGPGWSEFERHLVLVFVYGQVVLICESLEHIWRKQKAVCVNLCTGKRNRAQSLSYCKYHRRIISQIHIHVVFPVPLCYTHHK